MRKTALVEYPSSEDEERQVVVEPPRKKRQVQMKLPSLSAHLLPQVPIDNPSLHQGRKRTTPHVDGQFAAYVYVPVQVPKRSRLFRLLCRIFASAKREVPTLHPIGFDLDDIADPENEDLHTKGGAVELHVSLTRPTYLRAHQREEYKRAVQAAARSKQKFSASFATLSELTNDERTRTFLTLEVGGGHDDFKKLAEALTPILRSIRQKEFYDDPRFHVSIAWALLNGGQSPADDLESRLRTDRTSTAPARDPEDAAAASGRASPEAAFPTIPSFPSDLIPRLQEEFGRELNVANVSTFEAEELDVRIGKEVRRWRLLV
ncbi:hypothetical protein C8Q80DRAFT_1271367 [Daedaleopsis nitida]|nr:hypothetical protein C8Q80DRAFT_1271367 [Daedaleopsis nitida]